MEQFDLDRRSFLFWAKRNDVEVFAAQRKADRKKPAPAGKAPPPRIETFEWGRTEELLSTLIGEIHQLTHITNQKGAKHPKRFRPRRLPSPATALDALKEKARATAQQRTKAFLAMFESQPQAEWEAELAEHQAAVAAGRPSPVQERALAEAAAARATEQDSASAPDPPT